MTISTSLRGSSVTGPSGESGAAMYFGSGLTYFLENGSGRLYKYDANYDTSSSLNSGEWAATSYYMSTSSNTDGAACGIGSPTEALGSVSVTTSLNSCSSGSATSSIAVTASGATMYVDVQYSTNGGSSWSTLQDGNSISSGATETYTIPSAVSHGTTISWQYRSGTSNPSSGSYTAATAVTVSCATLSFTTSTSAGSCSSGSSTPTITVTNTGNSTGYFDVQWSIDNSSWTTLQNGNAIASGSNETYSVSSAQTHGTTVYFQVRSGLSNPSSGSYTAATSRTVDCPIIDVSASQSLGSCSAGAKTSTLTLSNSNSANTTCLLYTSDAADE